MKLQRRTVLGGAAALVIGFRFGKARASSPAAARLAPNAFLRIGADDVVTIIVPDVEMGQGAMTSGAMLVAEELGCDWKRIAVEHAPASRAYTMPGEMGLQNTGGSMSTRSSFETLRVAGAQARDLLVRAAAKRWRVDEASIRVEDGVVTDASGKRATFGDLVADAAKLKVRKKPALKDKKDFTLLGKGAPRVDVRAKSTGTAQFGIDVVRPGMVHATVVHCPVFGGKVKSFDAKAAREVKGVSDVFAIDGGVAIVADGFWPARKAAALVKVVWDEGPNATFSSEELTRRFEKAGNAEKAEKLREDGDAKEALAAAAKRVEAVYDVPFAAHVTMEPMTCVVELTKNGLDVWAGLQNHTLTVMALKKATGLPRKAIRLHTTFLGGGFGRRLEWDFLLDGVAIAKRVGKPVKLVWTREEDLQHDFYRPATWHKLEAGLDASGATIAWRHRIVCPSITKRFFSISDKVSLDIETRKPIWHDPTISDGALHVRYEVPNLRLEWVNVEYPVPTGFWRSVGASQNGFVVEAFVDELAQAAGKDPIELRKSLLSKHPRFVAALDLVKEKSGWGQPLPPRHGRGVAIVESFGSICAQVAEVSVSDEGEVRVHRVTAAVDCASFVNPSIIEAQMQGGIVWGLTSALKGPITIANGRVLQSGFHDYPMMRMHEMPRIETHILTSDAKMGGIGEVSVPPAAPALVNAIFAATGVRVRKLPVDPKLLAKGASTASR